MGRKNRGFAAFIDHTSDVSELKSAAEAPPPFPVPVSNERVAWLVAWHQEELKDRSGFTLLSALDSCGNGHKLIK